MFWQRHEKDKPDGFYSDEFKSFFNSMVQPDPACRPSILELLAHPWMKGPVPTDGEVRSELQFRMDSVYDAKKAEREEKRA